MTTASDRFALLSIGETRPRTFLLSAGVHRIGSLPDNDVVLAEPGVSRHHARLRVETDPSLLVLDDLASKNGTFVNGERIESRVVGLGDRLRFGPRTLVLETLSEGDADLAIHLLDEPEGSNSDPHPQTPTVRFDGSEPSPSWDLSFRSGYVVGTSPAMQALYERMEQVAGGELPILIVGETGVGKEWIARIVHESSGRTDGPFVALSCAAIPAELLEAELFGIGERVATGVAGRAGVLRRAHGGTLLLDEVGEMAPPLQAKLLRALEEQEIQPVGKAPEPVDVRIVAATNQRLERRIAEGSFRRDLYYRLAGCVLRVPGLEERPEDLPALVGCFLEKAVKTVGKPIRGLTRGALDALIHRPWPGNVRELEHEVERLVHACAPKAAITADLVEIPTEPEATESVEAPPPSGTFDPRRLPSLDLGHLERQVVTEALRRAEGNKTRAARLLGLSRRALSRRMDRYDLD